MLKPREMNVEQVKHRLSDVESEIERLRGIAREAVKDFRMLEKERRALKGRWVELQRYREA